MLCLKQVLTRAEKESFYQSKSIAAFNDGTGYFILLTTTKGL